MGTMYTTYACIYIPVMHLPLLGPSSIFFHTCVGLMVTSYHNGVVTSPGMIPDSWQNCPPLEFVERKKMGAVRFCSKEHKYKPDRAHYCRQQGHNVLRMDHHCPWLVNCIGFHNHKFFVLFLIYAVGASDFLSWKLLVALLLHHAALTPMAILMFSQTLLITGLLGGLLTPFLGFHLWMLAKNMTTIEFCEKQRSSGSGNEPTGNSGHYQSPYDLGLYNNIASVFGEDWWCWPFPTAGRQRSDGTTFPVSAAARAEIRWLLDAPPSPTTKPWEEADSAAASSNEVGRFQQLQQQLHQQLQQQLQEKPGEQQGEQLRQLLEELQQQQQLLPAGWQQLPKPLPGQEARSLEQPILQVGWALLSTFHGAGEGIQECCADFDALTGFKVSAATQWCRWGLEICSRASD